MYIENFESFAQQAEELCRQSPLKARYVSKYRHCDGKLVLKVTDDTTVRQRRGREAGLGTGAHGAAHPLAARRTRGARGAVPMLLTRPHPRSACNSRLTSRQT